MNAELLNATSTIVINHFGGLMFIEYIFLLHMLNYSCANSYLFNIHWLLVSHSITLVYLLCNKDVIRAIYIINCYLFMHFFLPRQLPLLPQCKLGTQHCVKKFVSDLGQVGRTPVHSTNKTDRRDISEILHKFTIQLIQYTIYIFT